MYVVVIRFIQELGDFALTSWVRIPLSRLANARHHLYIYIYISIYMCTYFSCPSNSGMLGYIQRAINVGCFCKRPCPPGGSVSVKVTFIQLILDNISCDNELSDELILDTLICTCDTAR